MKIAIIGGYGKMGQWFAATLKKEGNQVAIAGRDEQKLWEAGRRLNVETAGNEEAVKSADVVILSVPIDSFESVVKQISPYTKPEQKIIDITSVKMIPVAVMQKYFKKGQVLGTHPVFGPGARGIAHQNFVLTPTNESENILADKVKIFLKTRGGKVTLMTPDEHDRIMAVVLGLAHFISIVSADTLARFDNLPLLRAVGGSTYKVWLTLVESVISEDPALYASLQMNLPDVADYEDLFQKSVCLWADMVKNKDLRAFTERMTAVRDKLEKGNPDFGKAYKNMYKLVNEI
ncbi:prephenate dehydrogenase [Chloroflexota bacterium]